MTDAGTPPRSSAATPAGGTTAAAVPQRQAEIEVKLEAAADFVLPSLDHVPGVGHCAEPQRYSLDAVYFDTDRLDLLAARVTLRRRTGGGDAGWHLKLPGGHGARTEVTLGLDASDSDRQVPAALTTLIRGAVRDRGLSPVARLRTDRTVVRLHNEAGLPLVEVADDHVRAGAADLDVTGDAGDARDHTWRELEVEILQGSRADLDQTSRALLRAGARRSRSASKLGRALGAAGRQPSRPAGLDGYSRRSVAADVVRAHLEHQRRDVIAADLDLRLDTAGAAARAHTAVRRLRSTLAVFGELVGSDTRDDLRRALRRFDRLLTAVDQVDVLAERIRVGLAEEPAALAAPAAVEAAAVLGVRRDLARRGLADWLASDASIGMLVLIDRLLDSGGAADLSLTAERALPPLLAASWRRTGRRVTEALAEPEDTDRMRRARKACRHTRHGAELAGIAFGADAVVFAAAVEQVEEAVADRQNAVGCADLLLELSVDPRASGRIGFVWGRLHSFELATAAEAVDELTDAWSRAKDTAPLRWFR
ncbi:CYTH domain-containing protein [Nakamurella silvestris]|nr:CYTH domain-containing protein [Nakamurella silvestris]